MTDQFNFMDSYNYQGPSSSDNYTHIPSKSDILDLTPKTIVELLDQYVIGQKEAKKSLAIAAFNRILRTYDFYSNNYNTHIEKSNVLLLGDTGVGKTFLVKTLAKILDAPVAIADASSLTSSGYVGSSVASIIKQLVVNTKQSLVNKNITPSKENIRDVASMGIVYIDEIDKIASRSIEHGDRDISGTAVQEELLKILEGTEISLKDMTIDTTNILFICGGRFDGLTDIIKQRVSTKDASIGFANSLTNDTDDLTDDEILQQIAVEDLVQFGMIREFIGRIHQITPLHTLSEENLIQILTEARGGVIPQFQQLFMTYGVHVNFTPQVLRHFAKKALERGTGARALRSVVEHALTDIQYNLPEKLMLAYQVSCKNIRK